MTENTSTTSVTLWPLSHFDRDANVADWVDVTYTDPGQQSAGLALGTGTGLFKVKVTDPAEWLIWKLTGGDSGATITFTAVVYVNEQ